MPKPERSLLPALCLWLGALAAPPAVAADIYKFVDAQGNVVYTDEPAQPPHMRLVKTWKSWSAPRVTPAALRERRALHTEAITRAAQAARLSPELVHAVVRAESAYDPAAVSSAGAVGLMQLMPATARRYGVRDRTDPAQNLRGGTHYLRDLLDLFDGDLVLALAGYNAGENAVLRHGRAVPPYAETREYVRRVQDFYARYQQEGLPAPAPARAAEAARPPRAARLRWERGG